MRIDVTRFCGLSRREDFQNWLKSVSVKYYDELIYFLRLGKSCSDNKTKMEEIYDKLVKDGKSDLMIGFLKSTYPHMLILDKNDVVKTQTVNKENKENIEPKVINLSLDELNYHKVFPMYKPGLLLLPHQSILIDTNKRSLENRIIEFIRTKINSDYLILQGPDYYHGYVEYFEKKFNNEAVKLPHHDRPIFIYKKKFNLK